MNEPKAQTSPFFGIWVILFLISIIFTNLFLETQIQRDGMIKPHHLFAVITGIFVVLKGRYSRIPLPILCYFCTGVLFAVPAAILYPAPMQSLQFPYCFYLVFLGGCCAANFKYEKFAKLFQSTFLICLLAVIVKNIYYLDLILSFVRNPTERLLYLAPTFIGGGINLEGSLLAIGSTSFIRNRWFLPYWAGALAINLLYVSRTGILISFLILLFQLSSKGKVSAKTIALVLIVVSLIAVLAFIGTQSIGVLSYAYERFTSIGNETGSMGRLKMWSHAAELIENNPFGYGVMNSTLMIKSLLDQSVSEGNIHNIYMQICIDLGVFSLIAFFVMVFWVFHSGWRYRSHNVIGLFLITYFVGGLVQFRAYDPFAYFVLGVFAHYLRTTRKNVDTVPPHFKYNQ